MKGKKYELIVAGVNPEGVIRRINQILNEHLGEDKDCIKKRFWYDCEYFEK
jgi:hypothetical protein